MFGLRVGRLGKIGDRAKITPGVLRGLILGSGILSGAPTVSRKLTGSLTGIGTLAGTLTVGAGGANTAGQPIGLLLIMTKAS